MKKFFMMGMALVVSLAMLTTSCHKDETNNNGNSNGNTENPGGGSGSGGSGSGDRIIPNAVTDIDGNIYDAVQIGNQVWMAENLRTTKYADGTSIPLGTSASETTAYRYAPGPNQSNEENMTNVTSYGYLYNWPAVMHGASSSESNPSGVRGICPTGWHVPSDAEWTELTNYVSSQSQYVCGDNNNRIAKALASTIGWNSSTGTYAVGNNPNTNNATGFSALPAGEYNGSYINFGYYVYFWSATEGSGGGAYIRGLDYNYAYVDRDRYYEENGFSVRCVHD